MEVAVVAVAGGVVQEAVEVVAVEASLQLLGWCQQHGSFYREAGNKCPQRVQKFFCVVCSAFLPKHFFCFLCFLLCTNVNCYSH